MSYDSRESEDDFGDNKTTPQPCESYPSFWRHATIHLNPETGELHSDGDHRVRQWLEERIKQRRTDEPPG